MGLAALNVAGVEIPRSGFGTYALLGDTCERAVADALAAGYRHVDTAEMYDNEAAVGAGLRASGVPRDDIFLTSKVWHTNLAAIEAAAEGSLRRLKVDRLDLYLVHWPDPSVPMGRVMEGLNRVLERGLTRAIGISNHTAAMVDAAVAASAAPLAVNQVEYHPYLDQSAVRAALARHGMALTAYCPIARGAVLNDPVIGEIAARHGVSATAVALSWALSQEGTIVIPKTSSAKRMADNLSAEAIVLSADELAAINGLARPDGRMINPDFAPDWDVAA